MSATPHSAARTPPGPPARVSPLGARLDDAARDDRRRALRALLRRPLLVAEDLRGDLLPIVRRHRAALTEWFMQELGYRLVVETDFARLHKIAGTGPLPGRGLATRSGVPFDRRQYALLCLVLACLDKAGDQTTLAQLADETRMRAAEIAGLDIEFDRGADRWAFVHAVRACTDCGVLLLRDGDDDRFARGEEGGDALYRVHHRRLAHLLSAPVSPSSVGRPDEIAAEPYAETAEGAARRARHRLMRTLVEDPVLYFDELEPAERDYFTGQRARIERHLTDACGFEFELRAEGVVVVDPSGEATDADFPADGTVSHAALLLAGRLVERARAGGSAAARVVAVAEIGEIIAELAEDNARWWRSGVATDDGRARLADDALDTLVAFGLVHVTDGGRGLPTGSATGVAPDRCGSRGARSAAVQEAEADDDPQLAPGAAGTDAAGAVVVRPAAARFAVTAPTAGAAT